MSEVSIVVPVYKVEKYLVRCVKSLINQTLKDIEIILVDDGSPDNSGKICEDLAKADERIKVIHKQNGGLSSARNVGIKRASGKYIGFVDSDDDVELDMFSNMVETANKYNADFVMSDYIRILDTGKQSLVSSNIRAGVYSKDDIRNEIYPSLIMDENVDYGPLLSVWHCIYRKSFLEENNIMFADDVKWSEDNLFSSLVGYNANCFVYMKGKGYYHYYQNPGTITTSYRKGAWDVYKTMNSYLEQYFFKKEDFDFSRQLKLHLIYYACNVIRMECQNSQSYSEAKSRVKSILNDKKLMNAFDGLKLPMVNFKFKIQLIIMKYKLSSLLATLIRR